MEQDIRFCRVDGRRIAYATVGDGPLLLFGGGRWVSHLEEDWDDPAYRAFVLELARSHRVVRFDRLGVGLSDRELLEGGAADDLDTRTLTAVLDAFGDDPATLFAVSCATPAVTLYTAA